MRMRNLRWGVLLLIASGPAMASPSGVVISEIVTRGPVGGNDEFVELLNTGAAGVDIGNWKLQGCQSTTPGTPATRATVPAGTTLAPGQHFLFTNNGAGGYSGTVTGDLTYGTGFTDFSSTNFSGAQLVDAGNAKQDGVGAALSPCHEGTGIVTPTANGATNASRRKLDETQDTNDNAADFDLGQAQDPDNFAGDGGGGTEPNDHRIYEIQGSAHVSPLRGQVVTHVPGIVTQLRSNGFSMQDGDGDGDLATSDGIFVFTGGAPTVVVGQEVLVDGTVNEFRPGSSFTATNCPASSGACNLTDTELGAPTVTPASGLFSNNTVVPTIIGVGGRIPPNAILDNDTSGSVEIAAQTTYDPDQDGIDFYESLEGMLVEVDNARVVGPTNAFGEIWLVGDNGAQASGVNARGGVTITAGASGIDFNPERVMVDTSVLTADYPKADVGDTTPTVQGVLSYDFGNFRILPSTLPVFSSGGLAPSTSTVAVGTDRLRIASYNVENLDANDADTCDGGPDQDVANGRFTNEARQIVQNLGSPDVLGIEELQDNTGCTDDGVVSSTTTLDTLISAIAAAGGPTYSFTLIDPVNDQDGGVPGGNIRQGILYDPARLTLVPGTLGAGDSTSATAPVSGPDGSLRLTLSPGRIDPANAAWNSSRKPLAATFDFGGRRVLLIVNHFNSKGGDAPLFGRLQPPVLTSGTQRLQQATLEHDFVEAALSVDASARIVSLGDFNDFEFSAPLERLTGEDTGTPVLFDLAAQTLPPEERYSYVFEGNSQELDHLLVTGALLPDAEVQPIHINAEFADQVSDHDPAIASLHIAAPDLTPDPIVLVGVKNAERSTAYDSNTVTLTGFDGPAPITVTNGAYSINGGPFVTTPGSVVGGDTLTLRATSSAEFAKTVTAKVKIGPKFGEKFNVTTRKADMTPDAFVLGTVTGADLGTIYESEDVVVAGIEVPVSISIDSGGAYRINGGAYTTTPGTVVAGDTVRVSAQSASTYRTRVRATLKIGSASARFTVVTGPQP